MRVNMVECTQIGKSTELMAVECCRPGQAPGPSEMDHWALHLPMTSKSTECETRSLHLSSTTEHELMTRDEADKDVKFPQQRMFPCRASSGRQIRPSGVEI
jgi:hypothetical protein